MEKKGTTVKFLTLIYFAIAFFEVIAENYLNKTFICVLKPLIPLFLIVIYYINSDKKDILFIFAILFSLVTNILFIPNTPTFLLYGILVFTIHRILIIYITLSLLKIKDYIPLIITTLPFLLVFFYLFSQTPDIPANSIYVIILQNILISLFAGIALSSYVMDDNKQNSILLISALLFVMLHFIVFIEKYFFNHEYEQLFRPLAMTFNALAFYSFYSFVITAEKSNNNRLS